LTKKIPRGKVTTYGEIARVLKTSPRAVGRALHENQCLIKIPCHRVVKSDASLGGYVGGVEKKIKLLRNEGVGVRGEKIINLNKYFFKFE